MSDQRFHDQISGSGQLHFLNAFTASAGIAPRTMQMSLRRGRALRAHALRRAVTAPFLALARGVTAVAQAVKAHRDRVSTRRALMRLDERLLRDIGIEPHQLEQVVLGLGSPSKDPAHVSGPVPDRQAAPAATAAKSLRRAA